ncbi:MAG: hypothetical protein RL160_1843 [Bacteroidota bacterium]
MNLGAFGRWVLALTLMATSIPVLYAAEPTVQASSVTFQSLTCNSVRINWTRGNGARCIVLVKEGSAVDASPADGMSYTSFSAFGTGSEIGTGNFAVYNFLGNNVTITGLKSNTDYHIAVFEHDNNLPDFLTTNPARGNIRTHFLNVDFLYSYQDSCQFNNLFSFTNKTTSSFTGLTYFWTFGDGNSSTAKDPTHSYANGGNYFTSLTVTPSLGCPNVFANPKATLVIPNMFIRIGVNDTVQCLYNNSFQTINNDSTRIFNKLSFDYLWDFGDGETNTLPAPKKKYNKAGNYRIKHFVETYYSNNKTGCIDSGFLDVVVQPDPSTSSYVNDAVQCLKYQSFEFDNFTPDIISYSWDFGDANTSTLKNPTHKYAGTGTYTVIHRAQSNQGCVGSDTFQVQVTPSLNSAFSGLAPDYCLNDPPATLTPVVPGGLFWGNGINGNEFTPSLVGTFPITYVVSDTVCSDTSVQAVTVKPIPQFSLGSDINECVNGTVTLSTSQAGNYAWSTGSTASSITVSQSGNYALKVTENGCSWQDDINVFIGTAPKVRLPSDTSLCKGGFIYLSATWPKSTYRWSTGSSDSVILVSQSGTYSVDVTNPCGTASDAVNVLLQENICNLFIPTAFTPNRDGFNEFFEITGKDITPISLKIYNRWGQKVYENTDSEFRWDGTYGGKVCMPETYTWRFSYRLNLGAFSRINTFSGTVQLMW